MRPAAQSARPREGLGPESGRVCRRFSCSSSHFIQRQSWRLVAICLQVPSLDPQSVLLSQGRGRFIEPDTGAGETQEDKAGEGSGFSPPGRSRILQNCQLRKPFILWEKYTVPTCRLPRRNEDGIHHASVVRAPPRGPSLPCGCLEAHPLPSPPRSSLTFGTNWSGRSFQTPLPGPSRLPHGACSAWKPVFPGGPRGPRSAWRRLHVRRGHLGHEVGEFGCGG